MPIAGFVLGDERDRGAAQRQLGPAGDLPRVGEIDRQLDADDRLHAGLGQFFRKFERAEQVVEVGDASAGIESALARLASASIVSAPSRSE